MREHLRRDGADPAQIMIELTESAMQQDHADAEPILRELHDLGLRLALDDFGAGYSSLSRLREMPMDTLKIDRAFLREVPENREAAAIVTAILSLARALGRSSSPRAWRPRRSAASSRSTSAREVQGFLLARPMPVAEVEAAHGAELAADVGSRPCGGDGAQRAEGGEAAGGRAGGGARPRGARGARAAGRAGAADRRPARRASSRRSSRSRGASS